jgi:hypothetical protein
MTLFLIHKIPYLLIKQNLSLKKIEPNLNLQIKPIYYIVLLSDQKM